MAGRKNSIRGRFWFYRRHCDRDRRKPDRDLATLSVRHSPWERFPHQDCGRHYRSRFASTRRRDSQRGWPAKGILAVLTSSSSIRNSTATSVLAPLGGIVGFALHIEFAIIFVCD